jgi:hypothetical protein
MSDIPQGVLLLYTANKGVYSQPLYSTTIREFLIDPVLHPKPVAFKPLAPLLDTAFQVDKSL